MTLPYAEDFNYWKTSKSPAASWMEKTEKLIIDGGGIVTIQAKGMQDGNTAFLMEFSFGDDRFRAVWPVLPSDNNQAAERQAATALYHDVKVRVLRIKIFGARSAFFNFLMIPDGRTMDQLSSSEIVDANNLLPAPKNLI